MVRASILLLIFLLLLILFLILLFILILLLLLLPNRSRGFRLVADLFVYPTSFLPRFP